MIATFFGLWDEKNRVFCQKVFFRVFTTRIRASREMFWGKMISLSKKFYFFYHLWSMSDFFVFLAKFSTKVCQTSNQRAERKKLGKLTFEKVVFLQKINFGFWAEITWTFSKTVRHDSQNRSLHAQMNIFRIFSGIKNICRKVFSQWTETSDFRLKCFLGVAKGAFRMSSATLWEKDNESKLYFLWLV